MQAIEGAVIACAGLGSRLGMGMPKCMIEINGKTLLSRLIEILQPLIPIIHIVVGYREELIIEHCAKYHKNVVIIRNKDFRKTNTAHSIKMGSIGLKNKILYLDGDLIINPTTLENFINTAKFHTLTIGITRAKSSQAVFVETKLKDPHQSKIKEEILVTAFQRTPATQWEWANIFVGFPELLISGNNFVYECIEPHLPAVCCPLELHEIDTAEDLEQAKIWIESIKI